MDGDQIINDVYKNYQDGSYGLTERGVKFLLGYHLTRGESATVGFEIGIFGPHEASFSPDLDVLVTDTDLTGYEVKGYRGNTDKVKKDQLYKGLGQAITLLNQPVSKDGGALRHVCLAYPKSSQPDQLDKEWVQGFTTSLQKTPIGLVTVGVDEIEYVIKPSENPFHKGDRQPELLSALRDQASSADRYHPDIGLENLAAKIMKDKEYGDDPRII